MKRQECAGALALIAALGSFSAFAVPKAEAPTTDGNALAGLRAGAAGDSAAEICAAARTVLQQHVDEKAVAGAISLVSVSGRVEAAYVGLADPKTKRPMDEKSFFWIASMTKGFCGAAVMACVDRGLLSLDDPVEKHIPAMRDVRVGVKGADGRVTLKPTSKKMTIRMCLAHVAGYDFYTPETKARGSDRMSLADQAEAAAKFPLLWDVETKHRYANPDINLAARCVEVVTGMAYEDFLQQAFFDPLGMKDTTFFPTKEQFAHRVFVSRVKKDGPYTDGGNDGWAQMLKDDRIGRKGRFASAAGGLYATAGDVMKFYMMLANDGKAPDGTRLLSHASIVQLSTAQYPQFDCYTLGLRQFGDWFGHDGALQTEGYANWKENRAALLFIQVVGPWDHPFKMDWRKVVLAERSAAKPTPVFVCDFSTGREQSNKGVGTFEGPLPKNCGDNYSGWMAGQVKTSLLEEDGFRFTRFDTRGGSQFSVGGFDVTGPCYYRLTVKGRSIADPIRFFLRTSGPPYREYWSTGFASPEWREKSFVIRIDKTEKQRCSIFFATPVGECDLASVRLEQASEADFTSGVRRPPANVRQFFRHTRFPFGLPNGWSRYRETLEGEFTAEGEVLKVTSAPPAVGAKPGPCGFWTEPIQTNEPDKPITFSFDYRSEGKWYFEARTDDGKWISGSDFPPAADWKTVTFSVKEPTTSAAIALCVKGTGVFRLRQVRAWAGKDEPPADRTAEVALAPGPGEIAEMTRIQFADEKPVVRFKATGDVRGCVLKARVTDLYGQTRSLAPIALGADGTGTIDYGLFPERPLGQFRIDAVLGKDGRAVSPVEELVMTRLARPVAWGKDAPDSPFGGHFLAREDTIALMKAAGVNWARFHDACTDLSGWAHLEPTRGTWQWRDREIARFRDRKVKIFAQLGTAPAWVTHYGDLGCKSMGYFERYLRPTNDVETVRYVKTFVARYKGVIDDYFIWNEPWGSWWSHAADIRYYDKDKAGYDFGVFSRLVYGAVKDVHPAASVCGYNTFTGDTGRKWTAGVHSGGAYDACDAMDFHYYTSQRRCRPGRDSRVTEDPFAPIRAEHPDLGGKPVYMTEGQGSSGGSSSESGRLGGLYVRSVPWVPETTTDLAQAADRVARYVISLLAEDVRRIYLYSSHGYTALAVKPNFLQLLAADGFPHASTVGFSQMARMLEGKRFVRVETTGKESGVYVFEGPSGRVRVHTGLDRKAASALKGATDLYGNPVRPETFIPETLVYVAGD